jgi:hypothetical protein
VRKSEVAEYLGAGVEVVGVGERENGNGHVVERAFVQDFISGGAEGWTAEQVCLCFFLLSPVYFRSSCCCRVCTDPCIDLGRREDWRRGALDLQGCCGQGVCD